MKHGGFHQNPGALVSGGNLGLEPHVLSDVGTGGSPSAGHEALQPAGLAYNEATTSTGAEVDGRAAISFGPELPKLFRRGRTQA
jgi:hypothetical protein